MSVALSLSVSYVPPWIGRAWDPHTRLNAINNVKMIVFMFMLYDDPLRNLLERQATRQLKTTCAGQLHGAYINKDPDVPVSVAAKQRDAELTRKIAIQTGTDLVVIKDGKVRCIPAEGLRSRVCLSGQS